MCGIAGFCGNKNNNEYIIHRMTDAIIRRGPDSEGYWIDEDGCISLGHRRLAIIDCTENGAQPMVSHSGRYVISYNGEIYNYKLIRTELEKAGVRFRGNSDTETLVEAFDYFGIETTLNKIKGMFAFAIYDVISKTLFLVRDRVGEKPLYYGFVNGNFTFASDLSCFHSIPDNDLVIDSGSVELFFRRGFVPSPYSIYRGIHKLEAGHYLKISYPFKEYEDSTYWSALDVSIRCHNNMFRGNFDEASEELEQLIKNALIGQMISDVPLGAFLSAGVDSTSVVSLMQEVSSSPVKTFTIGIADSNNNEAPIAKEIAKILGTEHTETYISIPEILKVIPHIAEMYAEPHADSSQIPTSIISQIARRNVTVMLSGDGGDELLCGYEKYYRWILSEYEKQKRFPAAIQSLRASGLGLVGQGRSVKSRRLNSNSLQTIYSALFGWDTSFVNTDQIYLDSNDLFDGKSFSEEYDILMQMDFQEYMTDDILAKVDRAAMYHSLETRIPLLDKDVIEFIWSLPLDMKFSDGVTKKILRSILYKRIPRELIERPKTGFSIPMNVWLKKGELREWAESVLKSSLQKDQDLLNKSKVMKMWSQYINNDVWTDSLWYVLMFCSWKEKVGK